MQVATVREDRFNLPRRVESRSWENFRLNRTPALTLFQILTFTSLAGVIFDNLQQMFFLRIETFQLTKRDTTESGVSHFYVILAPVRYMLASNKCCLKNVKHVVYFEVVNRFSTLAPFILRC